MSNGVNFRELALDLRRQLTEAQDELAAIKGQADKPSHASQMAKRWGSIMPKAQGGVMPELKTLESALDDVCGIKGSIPFDEPIYTISLTEVAEVIRRLNAAAPSPAGVDGCKCSMSIRVLGDGCRHCQPQEYIDRLGEMLDEERAELSDAQGIIDGLRGAVADLYKTLRDGVSELSTLQSYVREVAVEDEDEESLEICDATDESIEHMQRVLDSYRHYLHCQQRSYHEHS